MVIHKHTIFEKTPKGLNESKNRWGIFGDRRQKILALIDGKLTVDEITSASGLKVNKILPELGVLLQDRLIRECFAPAAEFTIQSDGYKLQDIYVTVANTQAYMDAVEKLKSAEEARDDVELISLDDVTEKLQRESEQQARRTEAERQLQIETRVREESELTGRKEAERQAQEEADHLAREEAERIERMEAERHAREEIERRAREEAEHLAREAVARKAREDKIDRRLRAREKEARRAREEAELLAQAEAERLAREDVERQAREEEARRAREEAERLAQAEAERLAREEADRQVREEQARRAREEAERLAQAEAERLAREEAERQAREEETHRVREEAERLAQAEAERLAREEAERQAREEGAQRAREKAERLAQAEAERQAQEEAESQAKAEKARRKRDELAFRAQEKLERKARVKAENIAKKEARRIAREGREPGYGMAGLLARFKWVAAGGVAVLVVALVGIHFVPLTFARNQLEQLSTSKLGVPVKIGAVHIALFPALHLKLKQVQIGDSRVTDATIHAGWGTLLGRDRVVDGIELENIQLAPGMLEAAAGWPARNAQQQPSYRIAWIALRHMQIAANDSTLPLFRGEFHFAGSGSLEKAWLGSEDGNLRADFSPSREGLGVDISANEVKPLYFLPVKIASLRATARAGERKIHFGALDGSVSGGKLSGSLTLSWDSGWSVVGDMRIAGANLASLSAKTDFPAVSGKLDAAFGFSRQAALPEHLLAQPLLSGSVTLRDGAITGFDLPATLHYGVEAIYSGHTNYDVWSFRLEPAGDLQAYKSIRMAGKGLLLEGGGEVSARGALSGVVKLAVEARQKTVRGSYKLGGSLDQPVIHRVAN